MKTSPEPETANEPSVNPNAVNGAPEPNPLGGGAVATGAGLAGGAGGGLAGAALGSLAGPIGAAAGGIAGLVAGAVAGGVLGQRASEPLNPTVEETYWRENHSSQPYATATNYEDYAHAYRAGYEGQSKYATDHQSFDNAEAVIREDYATFQSPLDWERARLAANAAWKRRAEAAEHHSS